MPPRLADGGGPGSAEARPAASAGAEGARFRSLDAWRGICALFVAALHFETIGWIHTATLVQQAARLVDFFFVLSGFVIAHAYRDRLQAGEIAPFLVRRFGRLWPLHIATLGAAVAMALAGSAVGLTVQGFAYGALPANVTMTHGWGLVDGLTWNGPSWSISTEIFAYALFGLLSWGLAGTRLDAACAVVMFVSLAILVALAPLGMFSTYDFGLARCLFGFMAGVLAATAWRRAGFRPKGEIAAVLLTVLAVAWLPARASPLIVPVFAWVVLVFAADAGPVSKWLMRPFPQLLGRVSYSIYMTHYIVGLTFMTILVKFTDLTAEIRGDATVIAPWWLSDGLSLLYLAAVVALSTLSYAWIEKPGRAFFNERAEPVPAAW